MRKLILPLLMLACLANEPARASCINPAGVERDRIYNNDYHTYQFCNGSAWIAEGAPGGGGGMMLIGTQAASNSASLQFTNLPTSYNTLFLNCANLAKSNSTARLYFLVGEGAGPTWESATDYSISNMWEIPPATTPSSQGITSGTDLSAAGNLAGNQSTKMYIDNVGSSNLYKMATFSQSWSTGAVAFGMGYWNADTNPVTGLEIVPDTGTITSGTCSLYGMN